MRQSQSYKPLQKFKVYQVSFEPHHDQPREELRMLTDGYGVYRAGGGGLNTETYKVRNRSLKN